MYDYLRRKETLISIYITFRKKFLYEHGEYLNIDHVDMSWHFQIK